MSRVVDGMDGGERMVLLALLVVVAVAVVAASRWLEDGAAADRRSRGLGERLEIWAEAGLITQEQAATIESFELERLGPSSDSSVPDRRSLGAEAVGYVGAALALSALALLLSDLWEQLVVSGRLALVALLTALAGSGGLALNRNARPPMQRLASVLFATTVIGAGWLAFIVGNDLLELREADAGLLIGVTAMVVALPLYSWRRRPLPQLVVFVSAVIVIGSLMARTAIDLELLWIGLTFWAFGVAWMVLGAGNWIEPKPVAEVLGGAAALLAAQFASFDAARPWLLWLGVATAVALVALAVTTDRVHHLAVGALGLFVFVPQLVFEIFGDAIGAPATLLVVGLLLVLLAVGLGRARKEVGT